MDYAAAAHITRHDDWAAFRTARTGRLVLLTVEADQSYLDAAYRPDDMLMVGSEGAGVPPAVHEAADLRVCVPLAKDMRSLNVAVAAAMVLGEALRQTGLFPRS
jgi:tRNA (cytidine/uridine-2'-O-)-methyltransferase